MLWLTREMWTYRHIRVHQEVTLASPKFNPCIQRKTNQEESLQNNTENPQTFHQNLSSCTCKEHLGKPVLTGHNHQLSLLPPSRASEPGTAALRVQPQGHHSKVSCMWLNRRVSSSPPALHTALGFSRHHICFFSSTALHSGRQHLSHLLSRSQKSWSVIHSHSWGVSNHAGPEDTDSASLGSGTEPNISNATWQDNKYLFHILLRGWRSN